MPVALLDRDGTIIIDKHYLHDPDGVELLPQAAKGLKLLATNGWTLVVVTNQSGVGRGYFSVDDVHRVNQRLSKLLKAEGVTLEHYYHCPHDPSAGCPCRKPATGMVLEAASDLGFTPARCVVIGDKPADINLGRNLEARSVLVKTGKGTTSQSQCEPDHVADDLLQAAQWIVNKADKQ